MNIFKAIRGDFMLPLERQNQIIEILKSRRAATVDELCRALYSSGATVRRDLNLLEKDGLLKRTHGGAVLLEEGSHDTPMMLRENENISSKQLIAKRALPLIKDGQTIFLDSSSTCCVLAGALSKFSNLRVITNSLKSLNILSSFPGVTAYCTGGRLNGRALSLTGSAAVSFASRFHADMAFISCRGVDEEIGITETSEEETAVKAAYVNKSDRTVLLFDESKLGKKYFSKICDFSDVSYFICNKELPEKFKNREFNGEIAEVAGLK